LLLVRQIVSNVIIFVNMNILKIATAQFEHKSGDKAYNLSVIEI